MTELVKKYRAAPRQRSPERLDNLILSKAAHERPVQRPANSLFSPWKALAVSFSVAGLGVALLLRNGVPPLNGIAESEVADLSRDRMVAMNSTSDAVSASAEESVFRHRDDSAQKSAGAVTVPDAKQESGLQMSEQIAAPQPGLVTLDETTTTASDSTLVLPAPVAVESATVPESIPLEETDTLAQVTELSDIAAMADSASGSATAAGNENKLADNISRLQGSREIKERRSGIAAKAGTEADQSSKAASPPVTGLPTTASKQLSRSESADRFSGAVANNWLLGQSDNRFTLQLATADDVDYLIQFGATLNMPPPWYVVRLKTDQSDSFVLLSGLFETFEAATLHIEKLAPAARQFKPWVRNFGVLKGELVTP